jgi:predicted acylesterase/phospholipase RssA
MDGSVVIGRQTSPHRMPAPGVEIKPINFAQQGGGAHGAFTWGVLDGCSRTGGLSIPR